MTAPITLPPNIKTAWLVSIEFADDYTGYFTTAPFDIEFQGNDYLADSPLVSVGRLANSIKASESSTSIVFVGTDISFKQQLLAYNDIGVGGRPVYCYRVYMDGDYNVLYIRLRFASVIDSMSLTDNYPDDPSDGTEAASFNFMMNIKSQQEILRNRVAGRYTAQASMQMYYPNDTSMNVVPSLKDRIITLGRE